MSASFVSWAGIELFGRYAGCWHEGDASHNDFCRFQVTRVDVTSFVAEGISVPGEMGVVTHSYAFKSALAPDFVDKYAFPFPWFRARLMGSQTGRRD